MRYKSMEYNRIEEEDYLYVSDKIDSGVFVGKKIMVTGATGSIGRFIVGYFCWLNDCQQGNTEIYVLCRSKKKALQYFDFKKDWMHLIQQDIVEKIECTIDIDYIFHCASISVTSQFNNKPVEVISANTVGTYNVLDYARRHNVKSVLFFSSGAVYGTLPEEQSIVDENDHFDLDFLDLNNCYAQSKRQGEALCKAFWEEYNVPVKVVRISHTYGWGIDIDDGHIYSDIVKAFVKHEEIIIRTFGVVRNFCYISDAAIAFLLILINGRDGEVYNMENTKESWELYSLANYLSNNLMPERKILVKLCDRGKRVIKKQNCDVSKLYKLGWKPSVSVLEGFRKTIQCIELN